MTHVASGWYSLSRFTLWMRWAGQDGHDWFVMSQLLSLNKKSLWRTKKRTLSPAFSLSERFPYNSKESVRLFDIVTLSWRKHTCAGERSRWSATTVSMRKPGFMSRCLGAESGWSLPTLLNQNLKTKNPTKVTQNQLIQKEKRCWPGVSKSSAPSLSCVRRHVASLLRVTWRRLRALVIAPRRQRGLKAEWISQKSTF